LPLARIPWLFRKRLGTLSTSGNTLHEILLRPASFAKELCRPVRVSASDARQFRLMVLRIATLSTFVAAGMIAASTVQWAAIWSVRSTIMEQIVFGALMCFVLIPVGMVLTVIFFRLMTDLPTFIWRGMDGDPIHLAPVHHYASAPLALMPLLLIPLAIWLVVSYWIIPDAAWQLAATVALIACSAFVVLLLWIIPLRFMRVATGCGWGRALLLALYLPVHWLLMLFMCFLAFAVAVQTVASLLKGLL
jgi:hypothetical protein